MNDIDKALDHVFSLWIRSRTRWTCSNCNQEFNPPPEMREIPDETKKDSRGLHCSHFWGKGSGSLWTRWHDDCSDSLCGICHPQLEKRKSEGDEYWRLKNNWLGDHVFHFMTWLSNRSDPMYPQVKEFRLYELICKIGSRGYPTTWLFEKYAGLIRDLNVTFPMR